MKNTMAVMWDSTGLEAVANITNFERKRMWATLQGLDTGHVVQPNIMHWQLRARFNSQRHYEIWIFEADADITEDDVRTAFEADPQGMADTVRRIGHCFHSDRADQAVRIR